MKLKPLKRLRNIMAMLGGTKTCKKFVKRLNLKDGDGLDLILAPVNLLPLMGKLAETAGILPEGKTAALLAGAYAAIPLVVRSAMEDESSDEVVELNSDDMT